MELVLALVLFFALLACWLVLPGSTTAVVTAEAESIDATGLGRTTVGQSV